jgi:hypothetical protein
MLIDLARNDIGRIAQTGSVQVTDQMVIERTLTSCTSSPTSKVCCKTA